MGFFSRLMGGWGCGRFLGPRLGVSKLPAVLHRAQPLEGLLDAPVPIVHEVGLEPPHELLAPVSGELVHLENTNDPAFSSRAVGDGVAVVPQEGTVCAPVSGTVAALFPTEHALGIMSDDSSAQVMLHIGIDTVKLEGKGFHALVAQGDHVDAGQPLVEVDFDAVRAAGFDPTVFVIVCERSENSTLREHASGPVAVKEPVVWLSE